jgi:hypothetical protein
MRRATIALLFVVTLFAMLVSSASLSGVAAQTDSGPVIVTFASADGSTFRAVLEQPADIAAVQEALAGDGYAGIPNGALAYGDGGVNAPHNWHMVDTTLADMTIEVCDGTATMVDEDTAYWVETVGRFCPWSATVIAVEPLNATDPDDGFTLPPPPGSAEEVDPYLEQVMQLVDLLVAELLAILDDL